MDGLPSRAAELTNAGVVVSSTSPASTVGKMIHSLKTSCSRLIFTNVECLEIALEAAKAVGIPKRDVILFDSAPEGFITVAGLIEAGKDWATVTLVPPYVFPPGKKADEVCALLGSSSGTTGLPKAVSDALSVETSANRTRYESHMRI